MTTPISLSDELLKKLLKENLLARAIIIDIREPNEYAREHIPNSRNIPLATLAQTDFTKDRGKAAIFHCQLGGRTRTGQAAISDTGFSEIYCLEGGLEQWKRCGLPITTDPKVPIEIMRQVQIIAGLLVVIGIAAAYFINPYFILISLLVGLGLFVAGLTGFCGMAKLLQLMPWNKI